MGCNFYGQCENQKSIARFYNQTVQAFPANATTPIAINANQVVLDGKAIVPSLNSYRIDKTGLYRVSLDATILGTTAGNVSIEMLLDGTANPCATKTVTLVAEAYTTVHIETDIQFDQVCRCQNNTSHQVSFAIVSNGGAGNVVNVCSSVYKR